jgi:hypothetical protein
MKRRNSQIGALCELLEPRRLFSGPPLQVADGSLTNADAAATSVEMSGGASLTSGGADIPNGGSVTTTAVGIPDGASSGLDENVLAILNVDAPSTGTANNLQLTVNGSVVGTVTTDGSATEGVPAVLTGPQAAVGLETVAGATVMGADVSATDVQLDPSLTLGPSTKPERYGTPFRTIKLDSGIMSGEDGASLTCVWTCTSSPGGSVVHIGETGSRQVTLSNSASVDTPGNYTFKITVKDAAGNTKSVEKTINVPQIDTSLQVTATAGWVYDNTASGFTTTTFSAVALDEFGDPMATQPSSFSYSVVSGGGSISGDTYTGPSSGAGTAVIRV